MVQDMAEEKEDLKAGEDNVDISDENTKTCEEEKETEVSLNEEAEQEEEQPEETGKKSTFKKKEKKEKKDKKDEQLAELNDKVKRQMAEFDNFRKRTEKEKGQMFEIGAKSIVEAILPVVDNFERGLAAVPEEQKKDSFVEGMDKTYRHMMSVLEEAGVKPIEALGNEFDPNLHNAVMHIEDENLGESIVTEEFQKGYRYRDIVVRHSMVKVAN